MVTVKINDRTKEGKALFKFLRIYSAKNKGVEIIETEIKTKSNKDASISKNIPNAETLKAFRDNDKKGTKDLKKFDTVDALFEDAGIWAILYPSSIPLRKIWNGVKKGSYDFKLLKEVLNQLQFKGKLPAKYKPHKLTGNYKDRWECHIKPNWLLIWQQDDDLKKIYLERTGTHSDLFN